MAVVFENRVVEACTTLGTGNLVVSGADLGYSTFAEKVPVGSTIHYLCESVNAVGRPTGEFELGRGTYVAVNTISRDNVVSSSNAGALVDFTQSNKRLSLTVLAPASPVIRADWREVLGAQVEPGVIGYTAASVPPPGWLKRNGAAVSRTVYASLFAAIGTTYGSGDGTTTFNLPEGRGEFDRGWDDGRGVDAGRARGSAQTQQTPDHFHAMPFGWDDGSMLWMWNNGAILPAFGSQVIGVAGATLNGKSTGNSAFTGRFAYTETKKGESGVNAPRNVAYLPIIKF
ncbi:UNVERIFIED_ORG: phage-related tail fiber protein [Variovorax paradoxus]|nr:phage-related tail fiber protein [Variovorax paradoxus]